MVIILQCAKTERKVVGCVFFLFLVCESSEEKRMVSCDYTENIPSPLIRDSNYLVELL